MAGIVILGVFVADTAYRAVRMPKMGETILGNSFLLGPGGKGSNQSVAAARLGADVRFITKLGEDDFADLALNTWKEAGVTPVVEHLPDSYTGAAFIFVEESSGDNAIIISPGAAAHIGVADMEKNADLIAGASVFMTQLEQPLDAAQRALEIARNASVTTILNPAPAAPLSNEILALCDYITPNETEAEALTGISVDTVEDAQRASARFVELGVKTPIITLGERGAYVHGLGLIEAVKAGPVVETTGAGDAFNAGLATGLSEGKALKDAVRLACATAGLSVTKSGAAPSMPTRSQVDALLAKLG